MAKKPTHTEKDLLEKIAAMPDPWRAFGKRLHALIRETAPSLQPTTWYGMPAYANDGTTVCFFRCDKNYMTFGITQEAGLEVEAGAKDQLIESAWYFTSLDEATEDRLAKIVRKVAG